MLTYRGHTRMGSLNLLLFGLVLMGVSMAYPLTPHPQSHIHHTRMNERLSQTILQSQPALHHIPPDQILPRMAVWNFILLRIHNDLRNLLRFLARGPIMSVPQAFPRVDSQTTHIHNTHTCLRILTYPIPRSTHQYRTQACFIHTWHTHILLPRRLYPSPLHVNVVGQKKHKILGAKESG